MSAQNFIAIHQIVFEIISDTTRDFFPPSFFTTASATRNTGEVRHVAFTRQH